MAQFWHKRLCSSIGLSKASLALLQRKSKKVHFPRSPVVVGIHSSKAFFAVLHRLFSLFLKVVTIDTIIIITTISSSSINCFWRIEFIPTEIL